VVTDQRHTGIVVRDLEASLRFYRDVLGLVPWKRAVEEGRFIDQIVGLDSVRLSWVKLKAPNGGVIELLEYLSPVMLHHERAMQEKGMSHVAFTVGDLDESYKTLKNAGYECINPPALSLDGSVKVLYCRDPDGTIIELVQELNP